MQSFGGHVMIHTSCIHFPARDHLHPGGVSNARLRGAMLCFALPGLIPVTADIPSDKSYY